MTASTALPEKTANTCPIPFWAPFPIGVLTAQLVVNPVAYAVLPTVALLTACILFFPCTARWRAYRFLPLLFFAGFFWAWFRNEVFVIPSLAETLQNLCSPLRRAWYRVLREKIGGQEASLVGAMLLGERQGLSEVLKYRFSRLGISHILAISGLHLSLLCGALLRLLCFFRLSRSTALALSAAFAVAFTALCGFPCSLCRAMVMFVLYCLAQLTAQDADSLSSLCFAAFLICFISPTAITELSFQMSFCATLGLLALVNPMQKSLLRHFSKPLPRALVGFFGGILLATFSANLFLIPVSVLQGLDFAPAGFLVNFVFIPLATLILCAAPLILVFYGIAPLSALAASITHGSAKLFLHLSETFDASVGATVDLQPTFVTVLFLAFCFAALYSILRHGRTLRLLWIFLIFCLLYTVCSCLFIPG